MVRVRSLWFEFLPWVFMVSIHIPLMKLLTFVLMNLLVPRESTTITQRRLWVRCFTWPMMSWLNWLRSRSYVLLTMMVLPWLTIR